MGLAVFFDDYANTLVVGNTMRPVTDSMKVSRAKLAYIVDSTAAPVACIALVTTWIGYEVGLIGESIARTARPGSGGLPAVSLDHSLQLLSHADHSFRFHGRLQRQGFWADAQGRTTGTARGIRVNGSPRFIHGRRLRTHRSHRRQAATRHQRGAAHHGSGPVRDGRPVFYRASQR